MATTTYTTEDLKALVLDQVNKISSLEVPFTPTQSQEAYDAATRECGFETPTTSDEDRNVKYDWLIKRMRHWFHYQLYQEHLLKFDFSDMRASQITKALERLLDKSDESFRAARENPALSHIFMDGLDVFGEDMVMTSGFLDDAAGNDISYRGQVNPARRPRQPKSTQDVIG